MNTEQYLSRRYFHPLPVNMSYGASGFNMATRDVPRLDGGKK